MGSGKLFYKLWLPFLDYVNKKYSITDSLEQLIGPKGLNLVDVKEIADKMWDDVSDIDEYLAEYIQKISDEHRDII